MTAVTLKSSSRSTPGSRRSRCRSATGSRSSIAASSRARSVRWSPRLRLGQLDVPLLHGRAQDHLPADADGGGLGSGGERGYDDLVVAGRLGQAGQPPAAVELVAAERLLVVLGHRRGRGELDLALVAGAVAAAGGVDGDAVPRRRVEDGHARGHPDLARGRGRLEVLDREARSTRPVPSCCAVSLPGTEVSPSLRSRSGSNSSRGSSVMRWRRPWRGGRRSRPCPTRRGRGRRRPPSPPRRSAGCGCP